MANENSLNVQEIHGVAILPDADARYVQINDAPAHLVQPVCAALREKYPGFRADFCFHDAPAPIEQLRTIGATPLEDCVKMLAAPSTDTAHECTASMLTDADFDTFAMLHDRLHPDMYWDSRQILLHRAQWHIFGIWNDARLRAYIIMRAGNDAPHGEIYTIHAQTPQDYRALFAAALQHAGALAKTACIYMADAQGEEMAKAAAADAGFAAAGTYAAYSATL